jgi:tRNA (guanine37-N1)-methyltransferase
VVTPITAQRELVDRIVGHWTRGAGREHNDKRTDALSLVTIVPSLEEAVADVTARADGRPYVVATGARRRGGPTGYPELRQARLGEPQAMLVIFGTGWGLAESVFQGADCTLAPICGPDPSDQYNHLSVRSAVAIVLDRLFGTPERT